MLRALRWLLAVLVLAACCWWVYQHTGSRTVSTGGEVFPRDASSDSQDTKSGAGVSAPAKSEPAVVPAQPTTPLTNTVPAATPASESAEPPATPISGLPGSDSMPRDPPVGMAFGGSGRYQWYRQGDITWRIDTVSGAACVDFATMDEWAKPIVSSHGCRKS